MDRLHERADVERRRELFLELTAQADFRRLARFELAARKFPESLEMASSSALRDQIAARVVADQRRRDLDDERHV